MSGLPNGGLRAEFPRYCHMAEDVSGRNIHTGVPTQSPPRAEIRVSLNLKSLIFLSYFNKNWNASTYFSKKTFLMEIRSVVTCGKMDRLNMLKNFYSVLLSNATKIEPN